MNRVVVATSLAAMALMTSCGADPDGSGARDASSESVSPSASKSLATPTSPGYDLLSKAKLAAALLTIQDMPVGYSQDPPSAPGNKTFCDYKPPFTEKVYVTRDFTKGGGMSAEVVSLGLRQYGSPDEARAAFGALRKALRTCKTEVYDGTNMEYAAMAAPKVGDASLGVRITADGTALMQNFVLVGPTVVSTGGGGLMQANADQVAELLVAQVEKYRTKASR